MGKSLSSNYGQKLLDNTKKSARDALKTASKRAIQKKAEATGDLVGNKIAEIITKNALKNTWVSPSKSKMPAETDETSIQPIGIPKEKSTYGTHQSRMDQVKFVEDSL